MADINKRMLTVKNILISAIRMNGDQPFIPLWLAKEDAEMLIRWLDAKIMFEQTYGKEGTP